MRLHKRLLQQAGVLAAFTLAAAHAGAATYPSPAFKHPGVPLTAENLAAIKTQVQGGAAPWSTGYASLLASNTANCSTWVSHPMATVTRNSATSKVNTGVFENDMRAIFQMAMRGYIEGNEVCSKRARDILIEWATTNTTFNGNESQIELGDWVLKMVTGADILRGTWSGWTTSDTATVKAWFTRLYPSTFVGTVGPANKGDYGSVSGLYLALFNDDMAMYQSVMDSFFSAHQAGLGSTLPTGQIGESLRDAAHPYDQWFNVVQIAEALWSQGIDIYSTHGNRLLAVAEYQSRLTCNASATGSAGPCRTGAATTTYPAPWVGFGTTDWFYWTPPVASTSAWGAFGTMTGTNIARSAYKIRRGLPTPWLDKVYAGQTDDGFSFAFNKPWDTSYATGFTPIAPVAKNVSTGLTSVNLGAATGSGLSYSGGTWALSGTGVGNVSGTCTVDARGDTICPSTDAFRFAYLPVTGDATIVARVVSIGSTSTSAIAGVMLRETLDSVATTKPVAFIGARPSAGTSTSNRVWFDGKLLNWSGMFGGTNWQTSRASAAGRVFDDQNLNYWVKIARVGKWINAYISQDGTSWATVIAGRYDYLPETMYVGLVTASGSTATPITSTFSNVAITGGNGAAPVAIPAPPRSAVASAHGTSATVRWLPSNDATTYNVGRSLTAGGPYTVVARGLTGTSFTNTGLTSATTYYYAVAASNALGTSAFSSEDWAKTP